MLRPYVLRVLFADGFKRDLDLEPILRGPIFEPLRDVQMFALARVDHELGTFVWPNGAELAPSSCAKAIRRQRRANARGLARNRILAAGF